MLGIFETPPRLNSNQSKVYKISIITDRHTLNARLGWCDHVCRDQRINTQIYIFKAFTHGDRYVLGYDQGTRVQIIFTLNAILMTRF